MPHDPELVAETRAWLVRAERDLAAAAHELTAEPPFVEDIVFHAQQAAEKTLKAFLTWHGMGFGRPTASKSSASSASGSTPI